MMINDPIGDLLVRIKNGGIAHKKEIKAPSSRMKEDILKILSRSGYIAGYEVWEKNRWKELTVKLKYDARLVHVIKGIKRISTPGCHIYVSNSEIKRKVRGQDKLGILSTSRGVISHIDAQKQKLGGELLAIIW
jgi:small subunit ribosomal protein S8